MEIEAALLPPRIRLNKSLCQYAFRILKLSPYYPINQAIITESTELIEPDIGII
jgi:hypothetical protein